VFHLEKFGLALCVVVHVYNCSNEAEAGGLQVQGHPGLHSDTLSQKNQGLGM
jgi:hypothetical protein